MKLHPLDSTLLIIMGIFVLIGFGIFISGNEWLCFLVWGMATGIPITMAIVRSFDGYEEKIKNHHHEKKQDTDILDQTQSF